MFLGLTLNQKIIQFFVVVYLSLFQILLNAEPISSVKNQIKQPSQSPCHLVFGFTEWVPLQYINESGNAVGIQMALTKAVVENMGCSLSYRFGTWSENLMRLKEGEVDFIANATQTENRESYALFSIPYRKDEFAVFVKFKDKENFNSSSLESLKQSGFRLGLTQGYQYGDEIENWQNDEKYNEQLSYTLVAEKNIERVYESKIDGLLEDPFVISYKLRAKDINQPLVPLTTRTFGKKSAFMFSKKKIDAAFLAQFNESLKQTLKNPKHQSIWFNITN